MIKISLLLVTILCLVSCSPQKSSPLEGTQKLEKIRLKLNWFPEAEHGGYFHGVVSGMYKEAGLDVEIVSGGPGNPVETEVAVERFEFGIANADKILAVRENKLPIIGLFAPYQKSPRCLLAHKESGINSWDDIVKTKQLIVNDTKPYYAYLLKQYPSLKGIQTIKYSQATFMANKESIMQGYVNSEPIIMKQKGIEVKVLPVHDIGFNPYASVLITSEAMLKNNPELVAKMVEVTRHAWLAYLADPQAANHEILKRNPELGNSLSESMHILKDYMQADNFGEMTDQRWLILAEQLQKLGIIKDASLVKSAYTTEFIKNNLK
ncbi:MAG: ABC transporter substrate-binding protein [Lentisphaeria bacterium]|nr:ABC transporter substrate-binding protein [Lentisphaeria bacterium]